MEDDHPGGVRAEGAGGPRIPMEPRMKLTLLVAPVLLALGACTTLPLDLGDERDAGGFVDPGDLSPPLVVQSVALGDDTSCAVLVDGTVACWGADEWGQLALDSEIWTGPRCGDRSCVSAPAVSPYLAGVIDVEMGGTFACALTSRGAVSCWGSNRFGELGRAGGIDLQRHSTPVEIARDVVQIAAGRHHACARDAAGLVRCWGLAEHGRLGRPGAERCALPPELADDVGIAPGTDTVACSSAPMLVEGLGPVERIEAGANHTCAVRAGEVWCWGRDDHGQLGDGTTDDGRAAPERVGTLAGVELVALGARATYALEASGTISAWGDGTHGQLAVAPADLADCASGARCAPSPAARPLTLTAISAGTDHACGLDTEGRAFCWGRADDGRLGTAEPAPAACTTSSGDHACAVEPMPVDALPDGVRALAVGRAHACALLFSDFRGGASLHCWGDNTAGQLGAGVIGEPSPIPLEVPNTR